MPYTAPSYLILVFNLSPPDTTAQYRPRALRGSDPTMVRTGYDAPDIKWRLRRHVKVHWSSCLYHVQTSCSPDYVACHHLFVFFTFFLNPWFYKQMPPSCLPLFISWPRLPDPTLSQWSVSLLRTSDINCNLLLCNFETLLCPHHNFCDLWTTSGHSPHLSILRGEITLPGGQCAWSRSSLVQSSRGPAAGKLFFPATQAHPAATSTWFMRALKESLFLSLAVLWIRWTPWSPLLQPSDCVLKQMHRNLLA